MNNDNHIKSSNSCSNANAESGQLYPAYKSLVEFAQARGSTAQTAAGAKRFLLSHQPPALAGLQHLNHPERWGAARRPALPSGGWRDHAARAAAFVQRVAAACSLCPALGEYLASVKHPLTADVVTALEEKTYQVWLKITKSRLEHDEPYRRSLSSWAGGDHAITVQLGEVPAAVGGSVKVWSHNGKWSGTESYSRFTVTRRCLRAMRGELLVANLLTVDCESLGPREYRATWVEQGRGFGLKLVNGFIIRGQHVRAATMAHARRQAQRERDAQAQALLARRSKRHALGADLRDIQVTQADSIAAGNCAAGTSSFIRARLAFLKGATSIRASQLLSIADNVYTRRAVAEAVRRQKAGVTVTAAAVDAAASDEYPIAA